jgi:hypothetical protein
VRTVTLPKSLGPRDRAALVKPEVISTGTEPHHHTPDAAAGPPSVAIAHLAVDILHHQPEQPGFARAGRSVVSCDGPRLTSGANVSSDDLAVIRHASPPWQK